MADLGPVETGNQIIISLVLQSAWTVTVVDGAAGADAIASHSHNLRGEVDFHLHLSFIFLAREL